MHRAADRGLRGPYHSVADGRANLVEVRDLVTDEALKVRDARLHTYNVLLLGLGVAPCALGLLLSKLPKAIEFMLASPLPAIASHMAVALFLVSGATICVWAEFVLRVHSGLTFDELLNLDVGRWRPRQRVTIAIVISFLFAFLLAFDVIQVGLGGLLLNQFQKTPELALAVGGITGFAFPSVREILYRLKPEERR
jgi:hypothetical protein